MDKNQLRELINKMILLADEMERIKIHIYNNIKPEELTDDVLDTMTKIQNRSIVTTRDAIKNLSSITFEDLSDEEKLLRSVYNAGPSAIEEFVDDTNIDWSYQNYNSTMEMLERAFDNMSTSDINRFNAKYNIR